MLRAGHENEVLIGLIQSASFGQDGNLAEALNLCRKMNIPLERALVLTDCFTDSTIRQLVTAKESVERGSVSLGTAINALRLAMHEDIEFSLALRRLTMIHQKTAVVPSITNELTELLLSAKIITLEQLGQALRKSQETKILIGLTLVVCGHISCSFLMAAMAGLDLVRNKSLSKQETIEALQIAQSKSICIEQALFELGRFTAPSPGSLKLPELLRMSGFLSESDWAECIEIEMFKGKQFTQILLEQGLSSPQILEHATLLHEMTLSGELQPCQAAEALKWTFTNKVPVKHAIAEVTGREDLAYGYLRLGDLLAAARILEIEEIEAISGLEKERSVRIGKSLLEAGLISKSLLHRALRCQSLLKYGALSQKQAVDTMIYCHSQDLGLDQALLALGLFVPSRMQWSWV